MGAIFSLTPFMHLLWYLLFVLHHFVCKTPVVLGTSLTHIKQMHTCKTIRICAHRQNDLQTAVPFKPLRHVRPDISLKLITVHGCKHNPIKLWGLDICWVFGSLPNAQDFTSFCPPDTFVSLPLSRYKRESERRRESRNKTIFHPPPPLFPASFFYFLIVFIPLFSTYLCLAEWTAQFKRHYYAEWWGRRQDREARRRRRRSGMKRWKNLVDAQHLANVCLVNHLIPSPPKSNH